MPPNNEDRLHIDLDIAEQHDDVHGKSSRIKSLDEDNDVDIVNAKNNDMEVDSVSSRSVKELVLKGLSVVAFLYTLWVLASVVSWVSHLGKRAPVLAPYLINQGYPSNPVIEGGLVEFFAKNLPAAFLFVLPHSFIRVPLLQNKVSARFGRLIYSVMASASLHLFLSMFRPMNSAVLFTVPLGGDFNHALLSIVMLIYANVAMLRDWRTYDILGPAKALNPAAVFPVEEVTPRMDIITWMGFTTWNAGGNLAFILFSGLSILPAEVTMNDILPRVVAAIYLRLRSQGFRSWVANIDSVHHASWLIRGGLFLSAVSSSWSRIDQTQAMYMGIIACLVAVGLNRFEKFGGVAAWNHMIGK